MQETIRDKRQDERSNDRPDQRSGPEEHPDQRSHPNQCSPDLFYSPYFQNCKISNDHSELFPKMSSDFDFTLDYHRDRPSSLWSVRQIGRLQAKIEKSKSTGRFGTALTMKELFVMCNVVFGFEGWKTEVVSMEMSGYEEMDDGNGGIEEEVGDEGDVDGEIDREMDGEMDREMYRNQKVGLSTRPGTRPGSITAQLGISYDKDGLIIIDSPHPRLRYNVEVTATVRLTLQDKTYHEAQGIARVNNMPIKLLLFNKCKKESLNKALLNCVLQLKDVLLNHESSNYYR